MTDRRSICWRCGGTIYYVEYPAPYETFTGGEDVLDSWWAHQTHPADGHDAEPVHDEAPHR